MLYFLSMSGSDAPAGEALAGSEKIVMDHVAELRVKVELGARSYPIVICSGLLAGIGDHIAAVSRTKRIAIVTDRNVAKRYLGGVLRTLTQQGLAAVPIILPPGERAKTLAIVTVILDALAKHRFERSSLLIALGGGVIGDLAGFAAAIYQRGIPFIQVPTTLVAQVDSSVGGKTGVDHPLGKNLIGAFHQPRAVLIDPATLRTLPRREWIAGLAEVIKYGIIADERFFEELERSMPRLLALDPEAVCRVIARSCEIKAEVVASDERESDRRRILNYGHTIGHALESLGDYASLIHGEAVGIGLVQEADLAAYLGICTQDVVERIRALVHAAGLSDRMPKVSFRALWAAMQHDKKVVDGQVIGVWPAKIGEVTIAPLEQQVCAEWFAARHQANRLRRQKALVLRGRAKRPRKSKRKR